MRIRIIRYSTVLVCFLILSTFASAHVPYLEHVDFTEEQPFLVRKSVTQSKAIYAWLSVDDHNVSSDVDVFRFRIRQVPIQMYFELIVPMVDSLYEDFFPWYALVGPNFPLPNHSLPFELPEGYGAIVMENVAPGEERESFYEPFGGKSYYTGPVLELNLTEDGDYFVYVWDPQASGGDYVMVIGKQELFGPLDIIRSLIYTPLIRHDFELHVDEIDR